ncbi:MAG: dicarboxylate/amino acid:cation symporter [Treponema sp.]|jgi:Na+/H+-dicarboxylate symporter|nr:dicarboxylate/amino acid:cation symporter [Treponema sp.]
MKVWMKFLIGAALGLLAGFVLPVESSKAAIDFLSRLTIRVGRYAVLPLVLFSVAGAVYALHDAKRLYKPLGLVLLVIVLSSLFLTFMGLCSILLFQPPRIPISGETIVETVALDAGGLVEALFPYSGFSVLLNESFLLPVFLFAFLIGSACALDKTNSKLIASQLISLSKIFEYIAGFLMDIIAIGMIALACKWAVEFFQIYASGVYNTLILVLGIDFLLIVCVIYPLFVSFVCRGHKPYRVLSAGAASILAAFFSGDTNFTLPVNMKQTREGLNIQSAINAVSHTLFSAFARGGAALTAAVSFVIILHSYSSLGISFDTILWIAASAFGLSFLLPGLPSGGAFILLTVLCAKYGRGFEAGYLLLKPAALIVCSFATAIDAATAVFGTCIVALKLNMTEQRI